MPSDDPSSARTRPSLLRDLQSGPDHRRWEEFYRVYGRVIRDFSIRAGLNLTEAEEIVQETAIAVAKHLPKFNYNPQKCRFKSWLLNQASWRIKDQLKKRAQSEAMNASVGPETGREDSTGTETVHRVPDTSAIDLDLLFETEWRKNLFELALERVRNKFTLKQFQVFDLLVFKEWPAGDVAKSLGISLANVYVTKYRVTAAIKREATRAQTESLPR